MSPFLISLIIYFLFYQILPISKALKVSATGVPSQGIIDYIGRTDNIESQVSSETYNFLPSTRRQKFATRFNLWKQFPWNKIKGKIIIKAKIGGSFPLEATRPSLFSTVDAEEVASVEEIMNLLQYCAHDPRVKGILLEINGVSCGYAKLQEIRRSMNYFTQSKKKIIGYLSSASEKEYYLAQGCSEIYMPPDSNLDLRGFAAAPQFFRGIFDKIGLEPQGNKLTVVLINKT